MAEAETGIRRVGTAPALDRDELLSHLLRLTGDAVLVLDAAGAILLANDEALRTFPGALVPAEGLVGTDVRRLLPPVDAPAGEAAPGAAGSLPFACDGSTQRLTRTMPDGRPGTLTLRCEPLGTPDGELLLVARAEEGQGLAGTEHERLVGELSRANRRLAGTLDIVLGTLDSPDVGTLFERVLEELCVTMDASGSAVYLAVRGGFSLQATSASIADAAVPRFLPASGVVATLADSAEHALRLRVLPPEGQSLRQGALSRRKVLEERTQAVYEVPSDELSPLASIMAVPVRFGGRVIALVEVGWSRVRTIPEDDANLLDAVMRYLSVQLVGAFGALRTRRRQELAERANDLRDELVAGAVPEHAGGMVGAAVARDLDCACAVVDASTALEGQAVVHLPRSHEEVAVSEELLAGEGALRRVEAGSHLGSWLEAHGEPCMGALLDLGPADEGGVRLLALRDAGSEPFDDLEWDYLRQVVETVAALVAGDQGRRQDRRISQALQTGMRSELQQVEGISAQGIYSSATRSAFVGGDFYDLIALPERRACVIMGDVSGKGVEAASVSAAVRTALGAYSWEGLAPARMVALLNDYLLGFARIETFVTLFVGVVDLAAGKLTYCSAGHPPALLVRAGTGELEWLGVQSGVVGAFREMSYRNGRVRLAEGDQLLLYTDGTTEARAPGGAFFGEEGLRDAVMHEHPAGFEGLLDRLLADVDAFTGNNLDDDVAMVALRFDALG